MRLMSLFAMSLGTTGLAAGIVQPPVEDFATHMQFLASVAAGFVLLVGVLTGISTWVVEPKSRKLVREEMDKHLQDAHKKIDEKMASAERRIYADRDELMGLLSRIDKQLAGLVAEHRAISQGRHRRCDDPPEQDDMK